MPVPEWGLGDGYREPEVIIENCEADECPEVTARERSVTEAEIDTMLEEPAREADIFGAQGSRDLAAVSVLEVLSRGGDEEESADDVIEVYANQEMSTETEDHIDIEVKNNLIIHEFFLQN
jgi:hypothetical protein